MSFSRQVHKFIFIKNLLLPLYLQFSLSGQNMLCHTFFSQWRCASIFRLHIPTKSEASLGLCFLSSVLWATLYASSFMNYEDGAYGLSSGISFSRPTRWSIFIYELNSSHNTGKSTPLIILLCSFREKMIIDAGQRKMERRYQH